jgi:hypothetical protein
MISYPFCSRSIDHRNIVLGIEPQIAITEPWYKGRSKKLFLEPQRINAPPV